MRVTYTKIASGTYLRNSFVFCVCAVLRLMCCVWSVPGGWWRATGWSLTAWGSSWTRCTTTSSTSGIWTENSTHTWDTGQTSYDPTKHYHFAPVIGLVDLIRSSWLRSITTQVDSCPLSSLLSICTDARLAHCFWSLVKYFLLPSIWWVSNISYHQSISITLHELDYTNLRYNSQFTENGIVGISSLEESTFYTKAITKLQSWYIAEVTRT